MDFLSVANSSLLYLLVGIILLFISAMCIIFMIKSYKTGIKIGMSKDTLKRSIISSISFTILPSISILLGVIALSGTLGVPFSWLRLSVIGALQYELNVAEIAANSIGMNGLKVAEMNVSNFASIGLVMTLGILGGVICSIFFNKKYQTKIKSSVKEKKSSGFSNYITVAMFTGLCAAYIGSYVGIFVNYQNYLPLVVAICSGIIMTIFEYLINKKNLKFLENFSLATSMLIAMAVAVIISL